MSSRQKAVSLLLMTVVLAVAVGLLIHLFEVKRSLGEDEEALLAEIEDTATGEHGYKTIDADKRRLWEQRDALLSQERELQAQLDDLNTSTERTRQQIAVTQQYRRQRDNALLRNAILKARIEALSSLADRMDAIQQIQEDAVSGHITAEEAIAQLAALSVYDGSDAAAEQSESEQEPAAMDDEADGGAQPPDDSLPGE